MTNQIKHTHESLDHEEGRLLGLLFLAAQSTPAAYTVSRRSVERLLATTDKRRLELLTHYK